MAKRARDNRLGIPGYDDTRPPRAERKRQHRAVRHAANQMLAATADPEDLTLPDVRRHSRDDRMDSRAAASNGRFRVWKTKFWKRRDRYQTMKARLDSNWPVITSHQLDR